MIKQINQYEIDECVLVIKRSFKDIAEQLCITKENSPNYVLFSINSEKLKAQLDSGRLMFAAFEENKIVGYYSLNIMDKECEINNLCVIPECRHKGIGKKLLKHAIIKARESEINKINISIVEENSKLKKWYEDFSFTHTHTKKFDFFSFTCGYMEMIL